MVHHTMANTPVDIPTVQATTRVPGEILVTITDANRALRVTVGPEPYRIIVQPKGPGTCVIWNDTVVNDDAVAVVNHLEVPAGAAPVFQCGGSTRSRPHTRAAGFSIASTVAGQTVWIGFTEVTT